MGIAKDCPRCGHGIPRDDSVGEYPGALSRWDNRTEICSECGEEEGLLQFVTPPGYTRESVLHPTLGKKIWVIFRGRLMN